jgi:putative membrane protein
MEVMADKSKLRRLAWLPTEVYPIDKPVFSASILPVNQPVDPPGDPRVYLAAERTFLAWLRTGIALMGFGFVVARFGLFLRELEANQQTVKASHAGFSLPAGVLLIFLGVFVMVVAAFRHQRFIRAIDRGEFRQVFTPASGFWLAGLLALIGVAVAVYLVLVV